jgi:predicted adenylyl cyclase CyaB
MVQEIEQKFRLPDRDLTRAIEERCCELTENEGTNVVQRDEYFDTSDEELRRGDFTVRLRKAGDRVVLALKGPRVYQPGGVHRRIELEFEVSDQPKVRSQLEAQGLVITAVIDKRRREFSIQECLVALDTVPFIGAFIEIEGPSADMIEATRNALRLSADMVSKENYTELLEREFLKIGRPIRPHLVATFDAEGIEKRD